MYKDNFLRTSLGSISLPIKPLAAVMLVFAMAGQAHAAVNGGTVAGGVASINTNGATTVINQFSDRAVINWNSFDIGAGEKVQINQPRQRSAILNRVNSSTGTRIDGELNANGRVFVVNPNGIAVGESGKISGYSVTLSTLDISNDNFMDPAPADNKPGNLLNFSRVASKPEAAVVNDGTINAAEGGIVLMGAQVINGVNGTLNAKTNNPSDLALSFLAYLNTIHLIAGDNIQVTQDYRSIANNYVLSATPSDTLPNTGNYLVANDGNISSDAASIVLNSANNQGLGVRNTGSIDMTGYIVSGRKNNINTGVALKTGFSRNDGNYAGGGGSVNVGGVITAPGYVNVSAAKGSATMDGSINAFGQYGRVNLVSGLNTLIGGDAKVVAGDYVYIYGDSAATINGRVDASGNLDVNSNSVLVNGSVKGKQTNFRGDTVQLSQGSVLSPYYYVNGVYYKNN
jgi:filamentous hemagglutinin family protein